MWELFPVPDAARHSYAAPQSRDRNKHYLLDRPGLAAHREDALRSIRGTVLERQQHVHDLLAVARLLDVGDLAAAAISDAGLRDLA